MNGTCNDTIVLVPTPWGLGEGPKGQILLNFNYKVNLKYFFNQTLCVFPQMKDITYQTGFSFRRLGHAPWVGLGGVGVRN